MQVRAGLRDQPPVPSPESDARPIPRIILAGHTLLACCLSAFCYTDRVFLYIQLINIPTGVCLLHLSMTLRLALPPNLHGRKVQDKGRRPSFLLTWVNYKLREQMQDASMVKRGKKDCWFTRRHYSFSTVPKPECLSFLPLAVWKRQTGAHQRATTAIPAISISWAALQVNLACRGESRQAS